MPQEHYLNSANNLNNLISNYNNNNFNTEISSYNNPNVLTGMKKLARLSTVQPDLNNNIGNSNNPLLLQPKNSIFKQSKMNLNSNIIKNITKRSSLVLNNLGFNLAFRKSVYEPTGSSPLLCPSCSNYYYNNNNENTKPFNIGINEDVTELKNTTLSNTQLNMNPNSSENIINNNNSNINPSNNESNNNINMISETNLARLDNNNNAHNINSNKSLDKEMMVTNSSGKTSLAKSRNPSKNVSFFLNTEHKENLINNTYKYNTMDKSDALNNINDPENKQNLTTNAVKTVAKINNNKNSILKISKLRNYQNMNNYYNNNNNSSKDKKQNGDSKLINESDASIENVSHSKVFKKPSPDLIDRNKFFNQNINLDSNKNVDLITTFNNNNKNFNSQNQISKLVSTNNSNKIQLPFMKRNLNLNTEINDFEPANIRSKWEALRQSVISTTSNNNLKIIQDENFSELKLAKKETLLYKNCFESITTEYKKLKSSSLNTEMILNQDIDNYRDLKEVEIKKFAKALEMYNDLFSQEIKVKDLKIKQLAALIDHMVENDSGIDCFF